MEQNKDVERENNGPPAKRRRLSHPGDESAAIPAQQESAQTSNGTVPALSSGARVDQDQVAKEIKAGITAYVNPVAPGFTGVLKQRYTDFLVNEVLPDGRVLHLEKLSPPKRRREEVENKHVDPAVPAPIDGAVQPDSQENLDEKVKNKVEPNDEASNNVPAEQAVEISPEHHASLTSIFGSRTTALMISLNSAVLKYPQRKAKEFNAVTSEVVSDKEARTRAHQAVRDAFSSRLQTSTQNDNTILISALPPPVQARGGRVGSGGAPRVKNKMGWSELGGEYLHFTLYKENKDTMELVYYLASQLKVGVKDFQFGGTKDRRGVTVQRVSAYRVHAEQLVAVARRMFGGKVGDFEYRPDGLELGELGGNEFLITLRDCHFPGEEGLELSERTDLARKLVNESMESFRKGGFINYYGLQRFGSFAASTDSIGIKLLQGNLKGAIDDILSYSDVALAAAEAEQSTEKSSNNTEDQESESTKPPQTDALISSDDRARALAIHTWKTTQNSGAALALLPRKFSAESSIIRYLGFRDRRNKNHLSQLHDYQGALQSIQRNLRLMYVHAYQSLVWNVVAATRWERFGDKVIEGDLILVADIEKKTGQNPLDGQPLVDEAGEPIILPAGDNSSLSTVGASYQRARPLSVDEAASGLYSVFDVVLPLPGFDVEYPGGPVGQFYKEFMASERGGGLDPTNMRRGYRDLSLSGSYRKLLGRCPSEALKAEVRLYRGEEQLVETDAERLERKKGATQNGHGGAQEEETPASSSHTSEEERIAVLLQLRLGPSQYATMALRELMKLGGVQTFKPDYGSGR